MLEELNNLEKAILKTIAYYDIFDYPLTALEVGQWLWQYKGPFSETIFCLESSVGSHRRVSDLTLHDLPY